MNFACKARRAGPRPRRYGQAVIDLPFLVNGLQLQAVHEEKKEKRKRAASFGGAQAPPS